MESFNSHEKSIQKQEKLYHKKAENDLENMHDDAHARLYQIEEDIDNEANLIHSNMQKIENNPDKDTRLNEKAIERRQRKIEALLKTKNKEFEKINNIKTAEVGIKIYKDNPFQQN